MTVEELIRRLQEFPGYREAVIGKSPVTEVREQGRLVRDREVHGGQATDAAVVVVLQ